MPLRRNKTLLDQTIDQASDVVDATLPVIATAMSQAKDQVTELTKETKDKAAPLLAETRTLAGEVAEAAKEVAIPKAKATALAGAKVSADKAAEIAELAAAKATQVAEAAEAASEPKKSHKLRNTVVLGSLVAAAGFAASKMRARRAADNWQSSYTPPAPSPTTSATGGTSSGVTGSAGGAHLAPGVGPDQPVGADDPMVARAAEGDDAGGASPDEAIADAVEEPHPATTPDDPAEVVDIEPSEPGKKK